LNTLFHETFSLPAAAVAASATAAAAAVAAAGTAHFEGPAAIAAANVILALVPSCISLQGFEPHATEILRKLVQFCML
jgi:hypothetical protein